MKTFKDLILSCNWGSVRSALESHYKSDRYKDFSGYESVYLELLQTAPAENLENTKIVIGGGGDVSGVQEGESERFSLSLSHWEEWLGCFIEDELFNEDTAAHCIWDMTFYGKSNREVKAALFDLEQRTKEVQEGDSVEWRKVKRSPDQ